MSMNTCVHAWERRRKMIEISFILITNFEAAGETGLFSLTTTILCLFFPLVRNSCSKWDLSICQYPTVNTFFFFFLYSYDDRPSFPFSNHCLKKENLQEHFTSVPSPWQNAQPQYDAFKPFPPQTQGFHHIIILHSRGGGGRAERYDTIQAEVHGDRALECLKLSIPYVCIYPYTHAHTHTLTRAR